MPTPGFGRYFQIIFASCGPSDGILVVEIGDEGGEDRDGTFEEGVGFGEGEDLFSD